MRAPGLVAAALALAIGVTGCGGHEAAGGGAAPPAYGPAKAGHGREPALPRTAVRRTPRRARAALAAGQVGVLGIDGTAGVRPARLAVAADARVVGLRWRRWDARGASGEGTLELNGCDPTCAQGSPARVPARVELSGARVCGSAQWFDSARLTIRGAAAPSTPASYVRAPC